jgi:hypothetical protein
MQKLPLCLLLVALSAKPVGAEPQDAMEATKWREDLAFLREQMPKYHANLFHTMTRQQFDVALDALEGALPELTTGQVKLPNSGIVVQTSTLWWQMDPRDKRSFRAPDIAAEMRFADYANNVDPVLNAILKAGDSDSRR